MKTVKTAADFAGRLEPQGLPGMQEPTTTTLLPNGTTIHEPQKPVRVRARDKSFDADAIRRKVNCRVEEAAWFLGVSPARVREFVTDKMLAAGVRNRFLDPMPERVHLTVNVSSMLDLDLYRQECAQALLAGLKPRSFDEWKANPKERKQS